MLIAKLSIQQTLADAKQGGKDTPQDPYMVALGPGEKHALIFKVDSYIIKISKITKKAVTLHISNVHKKLINGEKVKKLYITDVTLHINESLSLTIGYVPTISFWRIRLLAILDSSGTKN